MSNELFDKLEQKVSTAVDTIEMLRMEVEELRQENEQLKNERTQWESRLNGILARFSDLTDDASQTS